MNRRKKGVMLLVGVVLLNLLGGISAHALGSDENGCQFAVEKLSDREPKGKGIQDTIQPYFDKTMTLSASLGFFDGVANIVGSVTGYSNRTTKIIGYAYLERKNGSKWMTVKAWSKTSYTWYLDIVEEMSGLSAGTYRLRFVSNVFEGSAYEQLTAYSAEKDLE